MIMRSLLASALLVLATAAFAATPTPAGAHVAHAWIRWLPANLPVAGYATIVNDSDAMVRLTSVRSASYGMVMLHRSRLAENDSRMQMVDHLDISPRSSVKLAPGGYHLMLMHATRTIKPGDKVKITLEFADGTSLQTDFSVLPANSTGPSD